MTTDVRPTLRVVSAARMCLDWVSVFYDKHHGENGILASPEGLSSQLPFYNGSNPFLAAFLKPRLVAGAMVSVEGRISYAYTGVN